MIDAPYRRNFILVLAIAVTTLFTVMISGFLTPLLMAAILAGLCHPLYRWLLALPFLGQRPGLAAAIVVAGGTIAFGLPFAGFIGMVSAQAAAIAPDFTPWVRQHLLSEDGLHKLVEWLPLADHIQPYIDTYRETILARLGAAVGEMGSFFVRSGTALTRSTLSFLLSLFVMLYAMFFFLSRGPQWISWLAGYLPLTDADRIQVLERGLSVTRATLKGILVIGMLQGGLMGLAFWACGISGALFLTALCVVFSALPAVGPPVVWIPVVIYLLMGGRVAEAVALTLWGSLVVGLLDNVLRPRIIGAETRLPDLLIFVSILGGVGMFGVLGLLIGPIIAAVMATTLDIYRYAFRADLPSEH
ncbi:MAG: AI-2E family transporter [Chromatiales bacterium]|jgi:predicted PurR-regulated permease PerM|nr:AI-2E family transporter [Chromatiales bacterium]